mgnify:CR=1 FL=1
MKKILVIVAGIVGLIFVIIGAALKINNNAISVIGGVDGPTSVFVATKLNSSSVSMFIVIGGSSNILLLEKKKVKLEAKEENK